MVATRIELPDDHGLIAGFVFRPGQPGVRLGWKELPQLAQLSRDGLIWLHFNFTDVRAREWITQGGILSAEAAEFLLAVDSRIRLDRLDGGIAGVLRDLHHDFDQDPESLGIIRFYADAGILVTGRRHPLTAVDRLRRQIIAGAPMDS